VTICTHTHTHTHIYIYIYRVSQEECARIREGVPYVNVYRYNPKHLCPTLNGYGDNGQRKVWSSCGPRHCTCQLTILSISDPECGVVFREFGLFWPMNCTAMQCRLGCFLNGWQVSCTGLLKCLLCFLTWNIVTCILCMDFEMTMQVLLFKNIKVVFPIERIPSRSVFTRIHQTLRDTDSLPSDSLQSEREVVRTINTRENILQMV